MNVWARIYAFVEVEPQPQFPHGECLTQVALFSPQTIAPQVGMLLYRTENAARQAQEKHGGVIVELVAASLRGQIEEFFERTAEGKTEVALIEALGTRVSGPPSPIIIDVGIACGRPENEEEERQLKKDRWLQQLGKELEIEWSY
jgi:hypothetical protein